MAGGHDFGTNAPYNDFEFKVVGIVLAKLFASSGPSRCVDVAAIKCQIRLLEIEMRITVLLPAFLAVLAVSTSAFAQGSPGTGSTNRYYTGEPGMPDTADERDVRHNSCNVGDSDACFAIEFGLCADRNPEIAIPACTRQLAQQEDRRVIGNTRLERAIRYMLRANAHTRLGQQSEALADYDLAVAAHGGVFWIQVQRGDAYFLARNFSEALISYDAALELNPDSTAALNNRSLILAAAPDEGIRNPSQALADARRANELLPGQPAYIDCLAVAYAANGDFENAVAEAERAIELLPPGNQAVLDDFNSRLALYRNEQPFRIPPAAGS